MLLLRLLPHGRLLELSPVGVGLHLPLPVFILLELALLIESGEQVLGLEGILGLSLLEFEPLLEVPVLPFQLLCSRLLAQLLFLQLCELGSSAPALRTYLEHVYALAVGRCTK